MDRQTSLQLTKYISLNILGTLSYSCYALADTYFIAKAFGITGMTALNFAVALMYVINGAALMLAMGGAIRFALSKGKPDRDAVFSSTLALCLLFGAGFLLAGLFGAKPLAVVFFCASPITQVFNSEHNLRMAQLAQRGLRLYFLGYLFAGFNITVSAYLGAAAQPRRAFLIAIQRCGLVVLPSVLLLSTLFGVDGVWISFPVAELLVAFYSLHCARSLRR